LVCDRVLADLDGRPVGCLEEQTRAALEQVPNATRWAENFTRGVSPSPKVFRRQSAPQIVRSAVEGIASACVPDRDALLKALLAQAIEECAAWVERDRDGHAPSGGATEEATPARPVPDSR
jgi:hypothetical protein